jgi:hypothetical protein
MVATVAGIHLGLDTHANRPAGNAVPDGSFYSCSTHGLIYKSNFAGNSWATWATLGGGAPAAHAASHENGGSDEIDVTGLTGAGGGAAGDPVEVLFGAPDVTYEFDTSSLTGLTAIGSPATEDADTTIPGHYFLRDNSAAIDLVGRYQAVPSYPFTAIARVGDHTVRTGNTRGGGLWIASNSAGNPAVIDISGFFSNSSLILTRYASPAGGWGGDPATLVLRSSTSVYFGLVGNSTTDFDWLVSYNGWTWFYLSEARNPSLTIAYLGIGLVTENSSSTAVAYDFLRIWNSAKTFPGV